MNKPCHACTKRDNQLGVMALEADIHPSAVYQALCSGCLAKWTDYLLEEIANEQRRRKSILKEAT